MATLVICRESPEAVMLSLLILGLAFLPFLPYDIAFLAMLVGRYFFHPKMQDLALSLLIQIILLDIFFFLSKKKSIFFLLLFSLLLLLLHGSYDPMDTGVTLKRLLPMAGGCAAPSIFGFAPPRRRRKSSPISDYYERSSYPLYSEGRSEHFLFLCVSF